MSNIKHGMLDGREVELREVSIGVALAARKASGGDNFETSMHVLVASAFYADDGEQVFRDRAAIDAAPMRLMQEVGKLASLAADANTSPAATPTTNGTGEAHPSL